MKKYLVTVVLSCVTEVDSTSKKDAEEMVEEVFKSSTLFQKYYFKEGEGTPIKFEVVNAQVDSDLTYAPKEET